MISNLRDLPSTTQAIAAHPAKPPRKIIPLHANRKLISHLCTCNRIAGLWVIVL